MIIKSFTAESAATALKKVREVMGGDALVLKLRQLPDAPADARLEVTAVLDRHSVADASAILTDIDAEQLDVTDSQPHDRGVSEIVEEATAVGELKQEPRVEGWPSEFSDEEEPPEPAAEQSPQEPETDLDHDNATVPSVQKSDRLDEIERKQGQLLDAGGETPAVVEMPSESHRITQAMLKDADLPDNYIRQLLDKETFAVTDIEELIGTVAENIESDLQGISVPGIELHPGDRVLFVGSTASGKTSALGKLAARLVLNGYHKVQLATIDSVKIGALDEIQSYSDLLGIEVVDAVDSESPDEGEEAAIILIDAPALPLQEDKYVTLQEKIEAVQPTHCLATVSALMRSSDMTWVVQRLKNLGATHLVATMLDQTDRYGSLVTAAQTGEMDLAYAIDTPGGIGAIKTIDPTEMALKIVEREIDHDQK